MAQRARDVRIQTTAEELPALVETRATIRSLGDRERGWDGFDALPPKRASITRALSWIDTMYRAAESTGCAWLAPYVTASANGEVVFEWWSGARKLTVYVSTQAAEYVKVWGADVVNEMADGSADSVESCRALWLWLTN